MNGADQILSQLTSAAIVVYVLQYLKQSSWFPWLAEHARRANRLAAMIGALASAIGVSITFHGDLIHGGTLSIANIGIISIIHGVWHWLNQYAAQQLMYDAVVKPQGGQAPAALPPPYSSLGAH